MSPPRVVARPAFALLTDADLGLGRRMYSLFVKGTQVGTLHRRVEESWTKPDCNGASSLKGYVRWWEARPLVRYVPVDVAADRYLAKWRGDEVYFQGAGGIGQRTKAEAVALIAEWLDANGWIGPDGKVVGPPAPIT